ncbi:hypothetical protein OAG56_04435 [Mariniblastus sp.]|nr:hypothetical protein [Mariniblastus sp.]MDB4756599.1 hypothetical protein [Mariniblastus sp.]
MPESLPPKPPNSELTDPLLESLLAKARPVIASERGLNTRSRVKIQSIGKKMNLPAAVIDQAMQLLHGLPPVQGNEDSPYELSFTKVMQEKISGIPGGILTTRIEDKAVSIGQRKYELSEVQARKIIRRVAEEVGVPRVTLNEAERHIEQEIADMIGEQTYLVGDVKKRLVKNGRRLGVSEDQIQAMIRRHLQFNFQQVKNEQKLTDRLWIIAGCIVAGTAVALFVFYQIHQARQEEQSTREDSSHPASKLATPGTTEDFVQSPEWWTDSLKVLLQKTRLKVKGFATLHERMKSKDAGQRRKAYRDLFSLDEGQVNPAAIQGRLTQVMPLIYQLEPDIDAALGILDGVQACCVFPAGKIPLSPHFFVKAFWAVEVLNDSLEGGTLTDQKLDALQERVKEISGRTFDLYLSQMPRFEKVQRALSGKYLEELIDIGPSFPETSPALYGKLEELIRGQLNDDQLQEYRYRFLVAFLRFEPGRWDQAAALLEAAIDEATVSQLSFFIDLMDSSDVQALQFFLQEHLENRAGFGGEFSTVDESVERLRNYFDLSAESDLPVVTAHGPRIGQLIKEFTLRCLAQDENIGKPQLAQLWAEATYLTTLIAIADSADPELIDRMLLAGFPDLNSADYFSALVGVENFSAGTDELNNGRPEPGSSEDRFQRQKLHSVLTQLKQFRILTPEKRLACLAVVRNVSPLVNRLNVEDATILARYLISRKSSQERSAVLETVPNLQHLPRLLIALADLLLVDSFPQSTTLDVVSLLLNEDVVMQGENWQIELSQYLYGKALDRLAAQQQLKRNDPVSNLNSILGFLLELRARLHGGVTSDLADDDLEGILTLTVSQLQKILEKQNKTEVLLRVSQEEKMSGSLAGDLLTRFAIKQNQIKLCLNGKTDPSDTTREVSEQGTLIQSLIQAKLGKYPTILGQIIENEFCLMQLYEQQNGSD